MLYTLSEIRTKPSNRREQDHFLYLSASLSDVLDAKDEMEARIKLIPNGWRDWCMLAAVMKNMVEKLKMTYEPAKRDQMKRTAHRCKHKLIIGPQVTTDEEQYVICASDFGVLMCAAADKCHLCMGTPEDCKRCDLGRVLDGVSFVSWQDRAWWEVFKRAERTDIGEEPGYAEE